VHPISPRALLRQADKLSGRRSSAREPGNADLRRAVSAAYYAVFHHIVLSLCRHHLPAASDEVRYTLARHITHRAVKQVSAWTIAPTSSPTRVRDAAALMRASRDLHDVAFNFSYLYDSRHDADYNHLADLRQSSTVASIDRAREAIASLDRAAGSPQAEVFFAHVALKSNL
jgi:hypothetical protein